MLLWLINRLSQLFMINTLILCSEYFSKAVFKHYIRHEEGWWTLTEVADKKEQINTQSTSDNLGFISM